MIAPTHDTTPPDHERRDQPESFWRRLLYRWFVEYNPLYLLSASLVLGGMILLSRGLASTGSLLGELGVAAIAEVYAFALIGGAALLTRIGLRRPAVMLTLLTVLYQWDLTLHTETCAHLGWAGLFAASVWGALFVGKLVALAWAMKVRLSRPAIATATIGAIGLAVLPVVLPDVGPRAGTTVVALWLSGSVFLLRGREASSVTSLVDLDAWGQTVLLRAVRASWALSGVLVALHVLFWSTHLRIDVRALVCIAPLVATRWIRSEARVWAVVVATLLLVALKLPAAFAGAAVVATIALASRAVLAARSPDPASVEQPKPIGTPYRIRGADGVLPTIAPEPALAAAAVIPGGRAAMLRLATGAILTLYLAIWTWGWAGGPWPAHVIPLDVLLALVVLAGVWRLRARIAVTPLAFAGVHLVVQARLVPAPRSALEWGGTLVGFGFVLLVGSLAASYWLRAPRSSSRA